MNRFEKRKLKANLYKHGNAIMYVLIFAIASVITIAAAANRTENVLYVDETAVSTAEKESVAIKDSSTDKVAATETDTETEAATEAKTEPDITQPEAEKETPESTAASGAKVKVTADTLKVRAQASQDSEMLGMVDMDEVFDVISVEGDWIEINYNGTQGYISAEYVTYVEE